MFINNPLHQRTLSGVTLLLIFILAVFLRLEDFSDWQKNPWVFKYQNEYLMTNMDSYYYLQFAKELQNGTYTSINQKRRVPNGVARPKIPPLLSLLAVNVSQISGAGLATVAILMPVFLSSLLVFLVYLLARQLSLDRPAALVASLFAGIAVGYIGRTRLGVFDTDSMNVVFALLNSYLILRFALLETAHRYWLLGAASISTFLYFIWWNTAGSVALLSAFVPLLVAICFFYRAENTRIKYAIWGLCALLGVLLLFFAGGQIINYIKQFILIQNSSSFPRVSSGVGELEAINIAGFIKRTTDSVSLFMLAIIGMAYFVKQQKIRVLLITAPFVLALLPFVAGNRFMIFAAPIVALAMGFFVQLLFDYQQKIKPIGVYLLTTGVVCFGIYSSYQTATANIFEPAILQLKHKPLLNALKKHTPDGADVWSEWPLGYAMQYYIDRGSFADGEIDDEIFYYLSFPLAAEEPALAANFMRFYHRYGKTGLHKLYATIGSEASTFRLLKTVLALPPSDARAVLIKQLNAKPALKTAELPDADAYLEFLYPQQNKPLYLLLTDRMTQTMGWFAQGKASLKTGRIKGLSLFLSFKKLEENATQIQNKVIRINKKDGSSVHVNGAKNDFAIIRTDDNGRIKVKNYPPLAGSRGDPSKRFVFEWQKKSGFGAAMSNQVAGTTFANLFVRAQESNYFQAIELNAPRYQIWQVHGDVYAK